MPSDREAQAAPPRRTIRLLVQYDGTAFGGFARQPNARTIQEELERALGATLQHPVSVVPAGRTDAGVHALGQVVSFRASTKLEATVLQRALNARLPEDVVVLEVADAPPDFHAQRSALGRWYRYTLWRGQERTIWWHRYSHHVPESLDLEAMRIASRLLLGRHDFRAFASGTSEPPSPRRTTERRVYRADWTEAGNFLYFDICADGFLRQMVRGIVGTLLWVGRGRMAPGAMAELLAAADRSAAGPNAPARGLTLVHVEYESIECLRGDAGLERLRRTGHLLPWP